MTPTKETDAKSKSNQSSVGNSSNEEDKLLIQQVLEAYNKQGGIKNPQPEEGVK